MIVVRTRALVVELFAETSTVKSLVLEPLSWPGHHPGQYVDLLSQPPEGQPLQASYCIASAPEDGYLVVSVEKPAHAGMSSYLCDQVAVGDWLHLRGPLGETFVWEPGNTAPVLLIAQGIGIAPFRSMLRHWVASRSRVAVRLLYAAASGGDVVYYDELLRLAAYDELDVRLVLTGQPPASGMVRPAQIDRSVLEEFAWPPSARPLIYLSGPGDFVDRTRLLLSDAGHVGEQVRTERFGS